MSKTPIKFGTDGWRGVIADDFTHDNLRRVAQATADYWNKTWPKSARTKPCAIVGYDNRFMSESYARTVCEVFAANGITALYPPESCPTPSVAYAVRDKQLCGAVMITASHNPPMFNGYKIKGPFAGPSDPETCTAIEKLVDKSPVRSTNFEEELRQGAIKMYDPRPAHVAAIKKIVNLNLIRRSNLRVVVDSMHGSGGTLLETILSGKSSRVKVQTIRSDRNPLFGGTNPEPIGKNLAPLCRAVTRAHAHVGIATDGDADRVGIVDDKGQYMSIQIVFALLLHHLASRSNKPSKGSVVRTINCTGLIDRICRKHGLPMIEVPVGFKYICAEMRARDVLIGGEESGGIGFRGHIPERDGILANLLLLEMLATTGKTVTELADELQREFGRSAYDRIDIRFPLELRAAFIESLRANPPRDLLGSPVVEVKDRDGVKFIAANGSWLMLRGSGTEPIFRIYSESTNLARVRKLLAYGQSRAGTFEKRARP
jgi:alpha-D-glucose phosphate-specific phosphoglucomutase